MNAAVLNDSVLLLIKFRVWGNVRLLSHAETIKVFQRACARASIKVRYSQGFNPRPKLSLPLPRSVGTASDDELLSLELEALDSVSTGPQSQLLFDTKQFKDTLGAQLPEGFELVSIKVAKTKTSPQPTSATYILAVKPEYIDEKLKVKIEILLASDHLYFNRPKSKGGDLRQVDVRPFLSSIELDEKGKADILPEDGRASVSIVVKCKISSAGTVRPCEILKMLEIDTQKLAAPVRRTNTEWIET